MRPTVQSYESKAVQGQKVALVVDDVEEMLDLLEIALNCAQFAVLRATSTAEAINLFEHNSDTIDLLMTEVRIGMDSGVDLAKRFQILKPSLQVLAISGFARDRRLVDAHSGISFLPRPFSSTELRRKLDSLFPAVSRA